MDNLAVLVCVPGNTVDTDTVSIGKWILNRGQEKIQLQNETS